MQGYSTLLLYVNLVVLVHRLMLIQFALFDLFCQFEPHLFGIPQHRIELLHPIFKTIGIKHPSLMLSGHFDFGRQLLYHLYFESALVEVYLFIPHQFLPPFCAASSSTSAIERCPVIESRIGVWKSALQQLAVCLHFFSHCGIVQLLRPAAVVDYCAFVLVDHLDEFCRQRRECGGEVVLLDGGVSSGGDNLWGVAVGKSVLDCLCQHLVESEFFSLATSFLLAVLLGSRWPFQLLLPVWEEGIVADLLFEFADCLQPCLGGVQYKIGSRCYCAHPLRKTAFLLASVQCMDEGDYLLEGGMFVVVQLGEAQCHVPFHATML